MVIMPLLSGCLRFGLETLHQRELKGTPYQLAMVKEYMTFSESEAKQYDWVDADHFARKAIAVLEGKEVLPEEISEWDIPETMMGSLVKARADVAKFVTKDMKTTQPRTLAAAIASFDCWVEQQEENWQDADISACRDRFYEQLNILNEATGGARITPEAMDEINQEDLFEEVPQEEGLAKTPAKNSGTVEAPIQALNPLAHLKDSTSKQNPARSVNAPSYKVYFDAGKTTLGREGMVVVNKIITDLREDNDFEIVLNGYADQSGNPAFNQSMSDKRASAVKKALVDKGIDEHVIIAQGLGAGASKNANAPANRRVEVFIINQKTK